MRKFKEFIGKFCCSCLLQTWYCAYASCVNSAAQMRYVKSFLSQSGTRGIYSSIFIKVDFCLFKMTFRGMRQLCSIVLSQGCVLTLYNAQSLCCESLKPKAFEISLELTKITYFKLKVAIVFLLHCLLFTFQLLNCFNARCTFIV